MIRVTFKDGTVREYPGVDRFRPPLMSEGGIWAGLYRRSEGGDVRVFDVRESEVLTFEYLPEDKPAPAPTPPQTAGQRIAERMITWEPPFLRVSHSSREYPWRLVGSEAGVLTIRAIVAAAIDKAVADEREACAKIADNLLLCIEGDGRTEKAIQAVKRGIAEHIRARRERGGCVQA